MIINNPMFFETDINIIIDTLTLLKPNDKPEWGSMSAQRMVEHLTDTVNLSFNEHRYTLQLPIDKVEKAQKFIFSDYELPKNFKASFASTNDKIRNASINEAIIEFEESWIDMIEYFKNNPDKLPSSYSQEQSEIQNSVDYVAGMTDRFAISTYNSIH